MNGIFKYIILVIVSIVVASILTILNKGVNFYEVCTSQIALLALLRTCMEKK